MTFAVLVSQYNWRAIRNCPGRYTLENKDLISFNDYYSALKEISVHESSTVDDIIQIVKFVDGGLISYRHNDGFLVHTLNNRSGFERKLKDLELDHLL